MNFKEILAIIQGKYNSNDEGRMNRMKNVVRLLDGYYIMSKIDLVENKSTRCMDYLTKLAVFNAYKDYWTYMFEEGAQIHVMDKALSSEEKFNKYNAEFVEATLEECIKFEDRSKPLMHAKIHPNCEYTDSLEVFQLLDEENIEESVLAFAQKLASMCAQYDNDGNCIMRYEVHEIC